MLRLKFHAESKVDQNFLILRLGRDQKFLILRLGKDQKRIVNVTRKIEKMF